MQDLLRASPGASWTSSGLGRGLRNYSQIQSVHPRFLFDGLGWKTSLGHERALMPPHPQAAQQVDCFINRHKEM